jgi:hypothetical protein
MATFWFRPPVIRNHPDRSSTLEVVPHGSERQRPYHPTVLLISLSSLKGECSVQISERERISKAHMALSSASWLGLSLALVLAGLYKAPATTKSALKVSCLPSR